MRESGSAGAYIDRRERDQARARLRECSSHTYTEHTYNTHTQFWARCVCVCVCVFVCVWAGRVASDRSGSVGDLNLCLFAPHRPASQAASQQSRRETVAAQTQRTTNEHCAGCDGYSRVDGRGSRASQTVAFSRLLQLCLVSAAANNPRAILRNSFIRSPTPATISFLITLR